MSGEVLGERISKTHFSPKAIDFIANEIVSIVDIAEIAIVVGGGNLVRGAELGLREAPPLVGD